MSTEMNFSDIARLIAFYLPQFHTFPENDAWWGKGFTEWTNVTRARPLLRGHYQPRLPSDLGFYDLRVPETRQEQAALAKEYGVHGFCYYHYWFGGKRLMERPFQAVIDSGEPDLPFCLCWANGNFTRAWDGRLREVLLAQEYDAEDDLAHIRSMFPIFADKRYIRINNRPLFLVYNAAALPDAKATTDRWREEARKNGFDDLFLCRVESYHEPQANDPRPLGFDAGVQFHPAGEVGCKPLYQTRRYVPLSWVGLQSKMYRMQSIYKYDEYARKAVTKTVTSYPRFPCVMPSWDNSARRKTGATIFLGEDPALYEVWLADTIKQAREAAQGVVPAGESPVVFINAWNEWAEGAHLEPDQRWGRGYLEATKRALLQNTSK